MEWVAATVGDDGYTLRGIKIIGEAKEKETVRLAAGEAG